MVYGCAFCGKFICVDLSSIDSLYCSYACQFADRDGETKLTWEEREIVTKRTYQEARNRRIKRIKNKVDK